MKHLLFAAAILPLAVPAAADSKVNPGQWQSRVIIEDVSMPGIPPQALAMMKNRPTTTSYCLTPEEAEANPEKMLAGDKSCKMRRFRFEGGKIDAEMACQTEMGPATMTMLGSYQPESYDMRMTMVSGQMKTISRVQATRLGPCKK